MVGARAATGTLGRVGAGFRRACAAQALVLATGRRVVPGVGGRATARAVGLAPGIGGLGVVALRARFTVDVTLTGLIVAGITRVRRT